MDEYKLYTKPAPPPAQDMETTDWPDSLRTVLGQLYSTRSDGHVGPLRIDKDDERAKATLSALSVGGTQAIATAARDLLDQLNQSDYGLILWVGDKDEVIEDFAV